MRIPLEISFHGISRSESLEQLIQNNAEKLERVCDRLISCRVGVKLDQKSSSTLNPFRIRVEMRTPPGHTLVVTNTSGTKEATEDLPTSINNTFKAAHRKLKRLVEKQQDRQQNHPGQEISGIIIKIFFEEGYGFLRSLEGEEIYFHRNSIVNDEFEQLEPGTGVNYTAEVGDKGLQASSVQILEKATGPADQSTTADDTLSPLGWQRQKV